MTFIVPFARKADLTKTPDGVDVSRPAEEDAGANPRRLAVSYPFSDNDAKWFSDTFKTDLTKLDEGLPADWKPPTRRHSAEQQAQHSA